MTEKKEIWLASTSEERWNSYEEYGSEAEAVAEAPSYFDLEPGDTFYVGRRAEVEFHQCWGQRAIELMAEAACDEAGEVAESWLNDVTKEQEDELEAEITKVIDAWLKRHGHEPKFFTIEEVGDHQAPEKAEATP